jgi:hypothetical protein
MGIDNNSLRFLAEAKRHGVDYSQTATIGRQNYYRLTPMRVRDALAAAGVAASAAEVDGFFHSHGVYADGLLRHLGADTLHSVDYSPYEKASHIFDMNLPAPGEMTGAYTTVIDGGSLEHVFNFPQAIANCMNMVAVGGHFIGLSPANNFFGHGFYQFSAELFFRIFEPANGFVTERMLLVEDDQAGRGWFDITDPAAARERVTLMSATPAHLFVLAKKVEQIAPFRAAPYQSDYVATWTAASHNRPHVPTPNSVHTAVRDALKYLVPDEAKEWLRRKLFPGPRARPDHFRQLP